MQLSSKLTFKILIVAAIYYVTGAMGLMLALPPGYATSFWPPAGISLGAILIFGFRVWPGVLLGALSVNVISQLNNNMLSWELFLPTLIPAMGTALQAIIGAKLVKRYAGYPNLLNEESSIVRFLILGGPVACTVAATIAVTTICISGQLPWSSFWFTWGTWWVGDSIGVMVLTPLLVFLANSKDRFSRKNISILIPSLLALALALYIYVRVSHWEQEKLENEMKAKSAEISNAIEKQLAAYIEVLNSVEGLFASSEKIEKHEFRRFVEGPLKRHPGLLALSWDLLIKESERVKVLNELRRQGIEIQIKEMAPDGAFYPAQKMEEYLVPVFIEPEAFNKKALGFNLYSYKKRKALVKESISTGEARVSHRIRVVQDPKRRSGLFIALPIYANGKPAENEADRNANVLGIVAGVLQLDNFILDTLRGYSLDGINFEIEDLSSDDSERVLYATENYYAKEVSSRDLEWRSNFSFAGREWRINFRKSYASLLEHRPWQAWFALAAGLLFAGLFTAFLMVIIGRASRIEELVIKRTEELAEAKANMISASKMSALGEMAGGMAHEINTPLTIINLKVAQIQLELDSPSANMAKVNDGLKKIEDTVARIAKIIKGLRYFARDTKNDPFMKMQISAILEDTLYLCTERLRYNGIVLKTGEYPEGLYVDCRPTEISQVILNLLNNACDAIMDLPERWIAIDVLKKGKTVQIRITDSGHGISPEVQEKIMQPFFTTKPFGKGTGIGLSISKGIIESHKGKLTIDNSVPNTCFVITLPIHQTES